MFFVHHHHMRRSYLDHNTFDVRSKNIFYFWLKTSSTLSVQYLPRLPQRVQLRSQLKPSSRYNWCFSSRVSFCVRSGFSLHLSSTLSLVLLLGVTWHRHPDLIVIVRLLSRGHLFMLITSHVSSAPWSVSISMSPTCKAASQLCWIGSRHLQAIFHRHLWPFTWLTRCQICQIFVSARTVPDCRRGEDRESFSWTACRKWKMTLSLCELPNGLACTQEHCLSLELSRMALSARTPAAMLCLGYYSLQAPVVQVTKKVSPEHERRRRRFFRERLKHAVRGTLTNRRCRVCDSRFSLYRLVFLQHRDLRHALDNSHDHCSIPESHVNVLNLLLPVHRFHRLLSVEWARSSSVQASRRWARNLEFLSCSFSLSDVGVERCASIHLHIASRS